MALLTKHKEDFILLAEAGFIAINQGDEDSALKLFQAAALLKPENMLPKVGMGYLHFLKLDLKQSTKIFQEVLDHDPENDMAKALLGLSIALTPNQANQGEKILEETAKETKVSSIKTMAKSAIAFVENFVKKSPSPANMSPKGHNKEHKKEHKKK